MRFIVQALASATVMVGAASAGTAPASLDYRGGYSELGSMLGVAGLAVGDLDGDGHKEIIVSGTTLTFGGPGILSVLRSDASSADGYRQVAFTEPYDAEITAATVLDLHGDGSQETLVGLGDGNVHIFKGSSLAPAGDAAVGGRVSQFLLADADDDGVLDLVVLSDSSITLLDPVTLQSRGTVPQGANEMAIGDVDADGHPEVVLNTGRVLRLARAGMALTSQTVWTYPAGDFGIHVGLVDIDGDGKPELIAESGWDYLTAFDLELQSPKWQINSLGDLDSMSFADVNGDGVPDALLGSGQWGDVTAIDLTNQQTLWAVQNPDSGTGRAIAADVDDDGVAELLWTGGHNDTGADNLFVYALPARTPKWMTLHVDGPFNAIAVRPGFGASAKVAFASFRSESGYDDGIVWQWNASTLAPLTSTEPNTFEAFAWTGIHALAYGMRRVGAEQTLLVGTDRLYTGALYGLDGQTGATLYQRLYDEGSPINALVAADLDGDGHGEIVAGTYGEHTGSPGRYVTVTDEVTGAELWRSINLTTTFGAVASLAVGNLDGGSAKDIAAVTSEAGSAGHLFQFVGANHVQWESSASNYTAVTTFDIDADGRDEVLVGTDAGAVQILDGVTHAVIGGVAVGTGDVSAVRAFRDPQTSAVRVATLVDRQLRVHDLQSHALVAVAAHTIQQTHALEVVDADGDNQMDFFVGGDSAFRVYRLFNDTIFQDGFN